MVRFRLNLIETNLSCDSAEDLFHEFFKILDKLNIEDIHYSAGAGCGMNIFDADAVIDAYSDASLVFLQKFITENNGTDFHGAPIEIESVKGIVVALDISVENYKKDSENYSFEIFYHNNLKLYFNNFYGLNKTLANDIENQLMTNNSELIFSFFKQWVGYENDVGYYLEMLPISNRVKIYTETIFLMDKEPKAYKPGIDQWH